MNPSIIALITILIICLIFTITTIIMIRTSPDSLPSFVQEAVLKTCSAHKDCDKDEFCYRRGETSYKCGACPHCHHARDGVDGTCGEYCTPVIKD